MCEACERKQDDVKWLALLARRVGLLIVTEIERRYDMPPSVLTKQQREQRQREQHAA